MRVRPDRSWLLGWLILLVQTTVLLAQTESLFQVPSLRYTTREGLAHLQVRHFVEDTYGQVWIGTQNGLSMFDGQRVHSFGPEYQLPKGKFYGYLRIDEQQRLCGLTFSEFFIFDGLRCLRYPIPAGWELIEYEPLGRGQFVFSLNGQGVAFFKDGRFYELKTLYPHLADAGLSFHTRDATTGQLVFMQRESREIWLLDADMQVCQRIPLPVQDGAAFGFVHNIAPRRTFLKVWEGLSSWYFELSEGILHLVFRVEYSQENWNPSAVQIEVFDKARTPEFFYLARGLVFQWRNGAYQKLDALCNDGIHDMILTRNRELCLATDNGMVVAHLNGWETLPTPFCSSPWSVLPLPGQEEVLIGCHRQGVQVIDKQGHLLRTEGFGPPMPNIDHQIFPGVLSSATPGRWYFGGLRGLYARTQNGKVQFQPLESETIEALAWDARRRELLLAGQRLWVLDSHERVLRTERIPEEMSRSQCCTHLAVSQRGERWLSCWGGVGRQDKPGGPWAVYTRENGLLPFESGFSLVEDRWGRVWCGGSEGLAVHPRGDSLFHAVYPGLIQHQVSQLLLVGQDTLLVVGSQDFYMLGLTDAAPVILAHFDQHYGYDLLEPGENGASLDEQGRLWVAAMSGIHRFDLADFKGGANGHALILLDEVNGQPVPNHARRKARFSMQGDRLIVQYRLVGPLAEKLQVEYAFDEGGPWVETTATRSLILDGFQHGTQRLYLRGVLNGLPKEFWPIAELEIDCVIPLFQRSEVQAGAGVLLSALLLWGLLGVVQQVQNRRALRALDTRMQQSRLKMIQAQLSPHFLFNAMTSLQNTIQNHPPEEASAQLVRLSRLIRQVLEISVHQSGDIHQQPLTTLDQELSLLQDYVLLEQQQRRPGFTFHMDLDPALEEENPEVPPLLIQPFVENAIHHGLAPMDRPGHIWLQISMVGPYLQYRIEDDGIGREASMAARSRSAVQHRSHGVELLNERIRILNTLGLECTLETQNRMPQGTIIVLQLKLAYERRHH